MNVEEYIKTNVTLEPARKTIIHLFLVSNRIEEVLAQAIKPFGISMQQFNVLRILRGRKGEPANLSTINERMVYKMSNTTRLVDKLISKGYVKRQVCPSNRRKIEITITEEGLAALAKIDVAVDKAQTEITRNLDLESMLTLNNILDKINV